MLRLRRRFLGSDEYLKAEMLALVPRLRRFACGLAGSMDEADELVQAACERAIRSLDTFERGSRLDSWMFRIIRNLHYSAWRDRRSRGRALEAKAWSEDGLFDGARAMDAYLDLGDLGRGVLDLDPDQRVVLLMVVVEGLSYQQVAEALDIPIGTVTSRLSRARLRLRAMLEGDQAIGSARRVVAGGKILE